MSCGCNKQNLARQRPFMEDFVSGGPAPETEPYLFARGAPLPPEITEPFANLPATPGRNERGQLVPFVMGYPVNPNGCQFDGRVLRNYSPYDYPSWML